ncbi:hypothetical protein E2553_21855 [Paraburkholderia dipogonis]|uniref:Uncharacterized protein n=2 Tax=Paraburkholderia dipogonis TaxID=1211383 RepID=A0A4Y8MPT7_9BURK|nr:hypothetical protein [Paraburkholderia dipogonis]TFE39487.1 hypothetical protein E2553_21855 [Paraburkholderia dipogonis]
MRKQESQKCLQENSIQCANFLQKSTGVECDRISQCAASRSNAAGSQVSLSQPVAGWMKSNIVDVEKQRAFARCLARQLDCMAYG